MRFESIPWADLDNSHLRAWRELRAAANLDSPFFSPDLVDLVARHRDGLRLACARDGGRIVALAPHWLDGGVARPYAGPLSDLQGMLIEPGASLDVLAMMRSLRISAVHFHAQLAAQQPLRDGFWNTAEFAYIDLSDGFEAYRQQRREAGSDELKEALRKGRKVQRDIGPMAFETQCRDLAVLKRLLMWKSRQLEAAGAFNALELPWVRGLLEETIHYQQGDCQGLLFALRIDGELAAGAVAVRSGHVLHGWVMAFNPDPKFRKFSPGILLLTEILQAAPALGITRVDMGAGGEAYKRSFQTGAFAVAEGSVDRRRVVGPMRRRLVELRDRLGSSPLRNRLQSWINQRRYSS